MGEVDSWSEKCPLEGRCSECGLELSWHDLLSLLRIVPRWSFEHARTRRGRAFFGTVSRAVLPWRLTRSLKLHHPFRLGRLVILLACVALMMYLSAVFNTLPIVLSDLIGSLQQTGGAYYSAADAIWLIAWPYQRDAYNVYRLTDVVGFTSLLAAWAGLAGALFPLVPATIRKHHVHPRHFVRMGVYCVAGVLAFAVMTQLVLSIRGIGHLIFTSTGVYIDATAYWPRRISKFIQLTSLPWMFVYWWCVYRFYMRLPHALAMSILLNLIGAMAGLVLVLLFTGMLR